MTERYLGSLISPSPVEPSEGFADSTASGVWNVHDPLIFGQAGDWPDPTNASPSKFIENLFSCFKYTGNSGSQTITNGIDLSNEGGLVWVKCRNSAENNRLFDTERGATYYLTSNSTAQHYAGFNQAFTSSGFSFNSDDASVNENNNTYISWTFRKQPKFFDVVTYTGDGNTSQTISHNLGSTPGFMIAKQTNGSGSWFTYHRSLGAEKYLNLNQSGGGPYDQTYIWNDTEPTSTHFTVGNDQDINESGESYVAYLFAHNNSDGGFGSTGDQDIIKCGSYTGNGSTNAITLGFEPQWLLIKKSSGSGDWLIFDNVRGIYTGSNDYFIKPHENEAESNYSALDLTSTGFTLTSDATLNQSSNTFIYVAIRRGPMITPTAGTQVFFPDLITANQSGITATGIGFSPDVIINLVRSNANYGQQVCSRITGPTKQIFTNGTSAEATTNGTALVSFDMDGYTLGADTAGTGWNAYTNYTSVKHCFKRAPGFFDVVAYTGDGGSNRAVTHNLGVAPEFIAIRCRSNGDNFRVTTTDAFPDGLIFNSGGSLQTGVSAFNGVSTPNATNFYVANDGEVNGSGRTYIAFLFATVAGVSKVGTYSGTGNNINVDCGFTSGARFVLITRTDSSGDWFVWDSERGIVDGNDPYLVFNNASAEVTGNDKIDPLSSGFTIPSDAGSDLNTSGGSYTFLAIA